MKMVIITMYWIMATITTIKMVSGCLLRIPLITQLIQQLQASRRSQNQKFQLRHQQNQSNQLQLQMIDRNNQQLQQNQNLRYQVLICQKILQLTVQKVISIHLLRNQSNQQNQNQKLQQDLLYQRLLVW